MSFFQTNDGTRLFYRDWGNGQPVVFVNSWALGGEMWEYQMVPLSQQGLRCLSFDRRGHGRSDDPGRGYDVTTLVDDLAAFLEYCDLHDVTLVGNSMGCAEIARYLSRHGTSRIARVALTCTVTPFLLQTEDNPGGAPEAVLNFQIAQMMANRPRYFADGATKFFAVGATWPAPPLLPPDMVQWGIDLIMQSSPYAIVECYRTLFTIDFRPDMAAFTVPTLIIHGDRDLNSPLELCGRRTAEAIPGSELLIYEGAPHGLFFTHRERLVQDLLRFIRG